MPIYDSTDKTQNTESSCHLPKTPKFQMEWMKIIILLLKVMIAAQIKISCICKCNIDNDKWSKFNCCKYVRFLSTIRSKKINVINSNTNKVFHATSVLMALKRKYLNLVMNDCRTIRSLNPNSLYVKGHLRGLVLMKMKQYKVAAAAFV